MEIPMRKTVQNGQEILKNEIMKGPNTKTHTHTHPKKERKIMAFHETNMIA